MVIANSFDYDQLTLSRTSKRDDFTATPGYLSYTDFFDRRDSGLGKGPFSTVVHINLLNLFSNTDNKEIFHDGARQAHQDQLRLFHPRRSGRLRGGLHRAARAGA